MKKRLFSLLLTFTLAFTTATPVFAASDAATNAANELHDLGLFGGTGMDTDGNPVYDLDRAPTRQEAVTMLVALLDKTEEAKSGKWEMPFTDVDNWAKPFVGYAYANGLVSGTSATTFGANETVTASQYLSFLLRVQGYESGKDFQWDKARELSDMIGLTDGSYNEKTTEFLRGDVAILSLQAHKMMDILKTAPDWGLPKDIKFIPVLETKADLENNILYSFLFGNYGLDFSNLSIKNSDFYTLSATVRNCVDSLADTYTVIAGPFNNAHIGCGMDNGILFIDFPEASLTPDVIYEQQLAALEKAREVKEMLHQEGKITDEMTEKEIAQVYCDYLSDLGVEPGDTDAADPGPRTVEFDSAYACLINKTADCVGRAAAFNLFMHLEGISAQGVTGITRGSESYDGHILSRVILDGKEYFCDWEQYTPLDDDITDWFTFNEEALEAARAVK